MKIRYNKKIKEVVNIFGINDYKLPDNASIEDIVEVTYKVFKEKHFTSFDYTKVEPIVFESKEILYKGYLDKCIPGVLYGAKLYESVTEDTPIDEAFPSERPFTVPDLGKFISKELYKAEREGYLCQYISIVMYWVLHSLSFSKIPNKLSYIQGFYQHQLRKDFPKFIPMHPVQQGIHSWISVDGMVIDVTIAQLRYFFDFDGKEPYIMGTIPEGLKYIGFHESEDICFAYAKKFSEIVNLTPEEWITRHSYAAGLCTKKFLDQIEK